MDRDFRGTGDVMSSGSVPGRSHRRASLDQMCRAIGSRTPLRLSLITFWLGAAISLWSTGCGEVTGVWIAVFAVALAAGMYFWVRVMLAVGILAPLLPLYRPLVGLRFYGWLLFGRPDDPGVQSAIWIGMIASLPLAVIVIALRCG